MVPDQHGNLTKPDNDAEVSFLLASGKEWRPFRPDPKDFEWSDVAVGASRIPRFNGQLSPQHGCKPWESYVLAQHLCLCTDIAMLLFPKTPVDVLLAIHLHDAEEALGGLGDPVGPVKHSPFFRSQFKAYFAPIIDAIADKAGIDRSILHGDTRVKQFDKLAYRVENAYLRGIGVDSVPVVPERHVWPTSPSTMKIWRTQEALNNWMDTLNELLARKEALPGDPRELAKLLREETIARGVDAREPSEKHPGPDGTFATIGVIDGVDGPLIEIDIPEQCQSFTMAQARSVLADLRAGVDVWDALRGGA